MPRKHLLIIISIYLPICLIYYFRTTQITYPGFPLDDSWIHQVFARNIATGHGFSFNPDQPVAGATAPLWTLVLALAWMIGGPIAGGIIAGILFQLLAYVAIYKIAHIITENRKLALLTAVLSVLFWQTIWGAMSGMEPGFYSALSLWGLYFYFKADRLSHKYSYLSYLLFTLAFLARPECALFIVASATRDFYEWMKSGKREFVPWIYKLAIVIALTVPYFVFNLHTAGSLLPLTFAAKVKGKDIVSSLIDGNFKRIAYAVAIYPLFYLQHLFRHALSINPIIVLASLGGIFKLLLTGGPLGSKKIMFGLLFLIYVPLMGTFSPTFSASMQHFRYITNLLPIMAFAGVIGLFWDEKADLERYSRKFIMIAILLVIMGIGLIFISRYFSELIIPIVTMERPHIKADQWDRIYEIVVRTGLGFSLIGVLGLIARGVNSDSFHSFAGKKAIRGALIAASIALGGFITIKNADTYANNIRNINECDIEAARFLGDLAQEGDVVAANDIGSFGYYSNMEVFDLWGLVNTELSREMIGNDSLIYEYMKVHKRVDYLAIAPIWMGYLSSRTDIFKPMRKIVSENNTILAEDTIIIYKAEWPDSIIYNYQEPE
ncbi:MAG: glycosyltransferase family 39 protein [Candidatus Zixiibacteriota bacterium]|nr:MAG: glycosyltransferase family 39 protein [candidate division Zixibacteria bacterium]